jgi:uncharacterized protein
MPTFRRLRLIIEMAVLYGVAPIAVYLLVYEYRVPLLTLLPWVFGGLIALLLLLERDYAWVKTVFSLPRLADVLKILGLFIICGGALTIYTAKFFPQFFLVFPNRAPGLWLRVMMLYPAISVVTQEIYFRVFFFHRYSAVFGPHRTAAIAVNAALFAFAHAAIFAYRQTPFHWQAIALSFAGGLIFARRFSHTKSFWAVALEHSLYGDLIFTIGLGVFFFTGVSNL